METKPVLAIDFGTSNTYITKCPGDQSTPVGIDFGEGRDGLATAILYRQGKPPIIGDKALEEFGDADESERQAYTIRAQFKPDIAHSEEARKYSRDFLKGVLTEAAQRHIEIQPLHRQVIFGTPSQADQDYHRALENVASQAGFGQIKIVDEPKGAVYFHVQRKDITPKEAMQGALVVDFGGGTCDFALVVRGEVQHSWGDMHLGGRLFDDIFYQWLIEQNPQAVAKMKAEYSEFFILWFRCRQIKEKFSQVMALDRKAKFRKAVGEWGRIEDVTWEKFLQHAREYRPSDTFRHYMGEMNPRVLERFTMDKAVDLLEWFRHSLRQGLQHERVRHRNIACIVLTGGSSSWPFVPEIVMEEMASIGYNPRLIRSDRPYVTISQGLSIIPSLQHRFAAIQSALHEEIPTFIQEKVQPLIERRIEETGKHIADSIAVSLFDRRIRPILQDFRASGGSVASLKQRIAKEAKAFEPQIKTIVEQKLAGVQAGLPVAIEELMSEWFKRHDLNIEHKLGDDRLSAGIDGKISIKDVDVYRDIEAIIATLSVGIVTTLVAMISGGAGTALITSGPLGLAIGALIGLIIGTLVVWYGLEEAKRRANHWDGAPAWLIRKALSEKKISTVRDDFKQQIKEKTLQQMTQMKGELEQKIYRTVAEIIDNLSAINQI